MIVGDGPDRATIASQVAKSGLGDRIWLTGARDDVAALMAGLDLFVLPSLAEGISNTILEAMACGLPIVATRVGGNAELVAEGRTGTLVSSDDAPALSTVLQAYARDAARVVAEGLAARLHVESRFSIDAMVSSYAELYDTLLDQRGNGRRTAVRPSAPAATRAAGHP